MYDTDGDPNRPDNIAVRNEFSELTDYSYGFPRDIETFCGIKKSGNPAINIVNKFKDGIVPMEKQAEIVDIEVEDGKVKSVTTNLDAVYNVDCVILATGTYLKGKIFIGDTSYESGPDGVSAANELSKCLKDLGINIVRFKTGTPARIQKDRECLFEDDCRRQQKRFFASV